MYRVPETASVLLRLVVQKFYSCILHVLAWWRYESAPPFSGGVKFFELNEDRGEYNVIHNWYVHLLVPRCRLLDISFPLLKRNVQVMCDFVLPPFMRFRHGEESCDRNRRNASLFRLYSVALFNWWDVSGKNILFFPSLSFSHVVLVIEDEWLLKMKVN